MELFASQLLNGIGTGVVYASLGLALVLIFRATGVLNFAQGEMALFSTYVTWWLTQRGLGIVLAIVVSMALSFVGGALIERLFIRPVEGKAPLVLVIVTLGLFLALNSLAQLLFGTDAKDDFPRVFPSTVWSFGDVRLTAQTLGLVAVLAAECVVLWLLFQKTKLGLAFRAVSSNRESSRLVGINVGTMLMLGWGLAAALGALAGAMIVPTQPALSAASMQAVLVFSFAGAALGGFDSPLGAVVGGITLGVAEAMSKQYVDVLDDIEILVPFALIGIVLLFRPSGLFGQRVVERV